MGLSDEILADLKAKKKPPMPMAKGPAAPDEGAADSAGDSYGSDEETIAQDIMDAKDPAAFADALKSFLDVCVPKIVDGMKGGVE